MRKKRIDGHAMKIRRVVADMSQVDAAVALGVRRETLSRWENGKMPMDWARRAEELYGEPSAVKLKDAVTVVDGIPNAGAAVMLDEVIAEPVYEEDEFSQKEFKLGPGDKPFRNLFIKQHGRPPKSPAELAAFRKQMGG